MSERSDREAQVSEAVAWYFQAVEAGRSPAPADFLARFPDLRPELESFLANQRAFDRTAGPAPDPNATMPPSVRPGPTAVDFAPARGDADATLPPHRNESSAAGPPGSARQFGDYELLAEIARGGMGVVYKARQRSLNRLVAVKMILAGELAGPDDVRRFRAEAESAAKIDHPNVLPIYEVGEQHGQQFFSMKLVGGGSLAARGKSLAGNFEEIARLMATLSRAVEAAHQHGLLHRDLKPANVLLDLDGTPFVTDFGLAKLASAEDGLTKTGAILGTPSYMAPEQARSERVLTPAVDVYALGAILYELLTGRPPFQGPTSLDTILEVLEREPLHPRAITPSADRDLSLIALKCLQKDPGQRYPSAESLAADLDRWLAGEAVIARRRAGPQRILAWARREPGLACRLVVIGLCAAIVRIKYQLDPSVGLGEHLQIMAILAGWALVSVACQSLLRRDRYSTGVVAAWLAADAGVLTGLLILDSSQESPLTLVYGLFVAASGVWLRPRLVWFATVVAVTGYVVLVLDTATRGGLTHAPHHHIIAGIALIAIGAVVAFQVKRARLLSRFRGSGTTRTN